MRLSVPGPRDLLGVLERGADQVEALLGVVPRIVALLDVAEVQVRRVRPLIDEVAAVAAVAALEAVRVAGVVDGAQAQVDRVAVVVERADLLVARATRLLDGLEPSLTMLQPTLEVLAETTDPAEVRALVRMVDHLPQLTSSLETDVLPVMASLSSVAPDIHDLLGVSRELNEILGKVPGFGRIKRRVEEEQDEAEQNESEQNESEQAS